MAAFLVKAESLKISYTLNNEEPFAAIIKVPHLEDALYETQSDDEQNLAIIQLYTTPGVENSYIINLKHLQGDFLALNDIY